MGDATGRGDGDDENSNEYDVLGLGSEFRTLESKADQERLDMFKAALHKAYRISALLFHPDKNIHKPECDCKHAAQQYMLIQ